MKIIVTILFCIFSFGTFSYGQDSLPPVVKYSKEYYLQKSKNKKTAAWLLLGVGTVAAIATAGATFKTMDVTVPLAAVGFLGSIPFFIGAAKNKKKAMHATVQFKMISQPDLSIALVKNRIPAIGLRINF